MEHKNGKLDYMGLIGSKCCGFIGNDVGILREIYGSRTKVTGLLKVP